MVSPPTCWSAESATQKTGQIPADMLNRYRHDNDNEHESGLHPANYPAWNADRMNNECQGTNVEWRTSRRIKVFDPDSGPDPEGK